QAKGIRQQCSAKQRGILDREACKGKHPGDNIERDEKRVDASNLPAQVARTIIEHVRERRNTKITAHETSGKKTRDAPVKKVWADSSESNIARKIPTCKFFAIRKNGQEGMLPICKQ